MYINPRLTKEVPPILKEEVRHAINQMKKGRAQGEDKVTADILKVGSEENHRYPDKSIQ